MQCHEHEVFPLGLADSDIINSTIYVTAIIYMQPINIKSTHTLVLRRRDLSSEDLLLPGPYCFWYPC